MKVKIIKGCTLAYLTTAHADSKETNQESKIMHISAATSEAKVEILPAISFQVITPVRKVLLQDAKILVETQEKLKCLVHAFEDIMTSSSSDIDYTKMNRDGYKK